mgnify:FL=1
MARVIVNRLIPIVEREIDEWQFGFRSGRGTQHAICIIRKIQEEARYRNQDVYVIFIDLEKAFDSVPRNVLWTCLKKLGINGRTLSMITQFHEGFKGLIGEHEFTMFKGVRQGCVLGPILFNIVFDRALKLAEANGMTGGVQLRNEDGTELKINHLAYADDLCLIDKDYNELTRNLRILNGVFQQLGLKINIKKTKIMNLNGDSKIQTAGCEMMSGIEWVTEFCYLGSIISSYGTCEADIRERIRKGYGKLRTLMPILKCPKLTIRSKRKLIESCILPVVYYGCENWRTTDTLVKKLQSLHNHGTRLVLGIRKDQKIRMDTITIGLPHPMDILAKRRLPFHALLATGNGPMIMKRVIESSMTEGKKISGRKKQQIKECLRVDTEWLFGETASFDDFLILIQQESAQLKMKDRIDSIICERRIIGRRSEDMPKLIRPRMKLFQCSYESCFREFAEQTELNRHEKQDHRPRVPQEEEPEGFNCHLCRKNYKTKGWLIRHLKTAHKIEEEQLVQIFPSRTNQSRQSEEGNLPLNAIPEDNATQVPIVDPNAASIGELEASPLETHLDYRLTDLTVRGTFRCPFRGCVKSTYTAKGMQNHGTTIHDWSFLTGLPKRARKRKADVPVGGLSGSL